MFYDPERDPLDGLDFHRLAGTFLLLLEWASPGFFSRAFLKWGALFPAGTAELRLLPLLHSSVFFFLLALRWKENPFGFPSAIPGRRVLLTGLGFPPFFRDAREPLDKGKAPSQQAEEASDLHHGKARRKRGDLATDLPRALTLLKASGDYTTLFIYVFRRAACMG